MAGGRFVSHDSWTSGRASVRVAYGRRPDRRVRSTGIYPKIVVTIKPIAGRLGCSRGSPVLVGAFRSATE